MRVLLVTDQLPGHVLGFQKSGHAQYLGSFLDYFTGRGDELTLVALRPKVDFAALSERTLRYRVVGPSFAHLAGALVLRSPAGLARWLAWSVFGRLPRRVQGLADAVRRRLRRARGSVHHLGTRLGPADVAYVRAAVDAIKPDLIVYDGIFNSCGRVDAIPHWLIAHEVKHQRAASFLGQGVDVGASAVSAETEASILAQMDNVIAIQWDDARELVRLVPNVAVTVVPAAMPPVPRTARAEAGSHRCVFVGSGSFHNYDGIAWFLERCWPNVRAAVPSATLEIFGSVCLRLGELPPGVVLRGIVEDLAPAYAGAAVTIVPLRIGSGLKVKLVEAFAFGQAVVTTPVGAQGLMEFTPRPFVLAEPAEFAAATISLLNAPARQRELRSAALRCAESFTPEAAFAPLDAALAGAAGACA